MTPLARIVCILLALALCACVPIGVRVQNLPYAAAASAR
jgi:hypothetical protein